MDRIKKSSSLLFTIFCGALILIYQINNTWVSIYEDETISGCDSFGYSRQAQLFRQSDSSIAALDTSLKGDVQDVLREWATTTEIPESDWYQMIAPHAHHFRSIENKSILQYPPGTGWILSHFKQATSRRTLWILSYAGISSIFLITLKSSRSQFSNICLALIGMGSLYITNTFAYRSDSLAPSCVLASFLSYLTIVNLRQISVNDRYLLVFKNIMLIGFLIGLSLSLRPGNLFFITSQFPIFYLIWKNNRLYFIKSSILFLLSFALGGVPLFSANYINTGNAFLTTYSPLDTKLNFSKLFFNLSLIPTDSEVVFITSIIVLIFSILIWNMSSNDLNRNIIRTILLTAWTGLILSVIIMTLKDIFIPYYLVPQVVLTIGMVGMTNIMRNESNQIFGNFNKLITYILVSLSFFIFILSAFNIKPLSYDSDPLINQNKSSSIVWADSLGSNLYFYYGINTAKLGFSSLKSRTEIINYLNNKKIKQLILDDSNTVELFKNSSQGVLIPSTSFQGRIIYEYVPK